MQLFGRKFRTAGVFLVVAVVFGIFFIARTPLLWGTDETSHIARVYQLSEGHIWQDHLRDPRQKDVYVAYQIPQNLHRLIVSVNDDLIDNATPKAGQTVKYVDNTATYTDLGKLHMDGSKRIAYGFPNTAAYSPVAYTPALIGMGVARLFQANIFWTIMLVRFCDLAMFVGVIYVALRIVDAYRVKWLLFSIALLPTALYSGSIISADGETTAVVLLFVAILIKAFLGPTVALRKNEVRLLIAVTILLPLLKPGYIILLPLQLLIANNQFSSRKAAYMIKSIPLIIAGILFILWSHSVSGAVKNEAIIRPGGGWELVSPSAQARFIAGHPFAYAKVLARTLRVGSSQYFMELIGDLGFQHVRLPGVGVIMEVMALLAALVMSERPRLKKLIPFSLLGVGFAGALLIATTFYLTYTNVAGPLVRGIQGRYFIPLMPFVLFGMGTLGGDRLRLNKRVYSYDQATWTLCFLVICSLSLVAIKYEYLTWGLGKL